MNFLKLCRSLLNLYPREYREQFAVEILAVLEERCRERRGRGRMAFARFALAEIKGLFAGAVREWTATSAPVPRAEPQDEAGAIRVRIEFNLRRMEYAIAHHDFPGARFYSEEDRKDRERLSRLMSAGES